ncbi:hypothetical protein C8R47DRAFT_1063602 [Mycena vitilis]|nr:hypothetical protein C8R47DRAFT_1063602 [Mycena vitilis]
MAGVPARVKLLYGPSDHRRRALVSLQIYERKVPNEPGEWTKNQMFKLAKGISEVAAKSFDFFRVLPSLTVIYASYRYIKFFGKAVGRQGQKIDMENPCRTGLKEGGAPRREEPERQIGCPASTSKSGLLHQKKLGIANPALAVLQHRDTLAIGRPARIPRGAFLCVQGQSSSSEIPSDSPGEPHRAPRCMQRRRHRRHGVRFERHKCRVHNRCPREEADTPFAWGKHTTRRPGCAHACLPTSLGKQTRAIGAFHTARSPVDQGVHLSDTVNPAWSLMRMWYLHTAPAREVRREERDSCATPPSPPALPIDFSPLSFAGPEKEGT